MEQPFWLNKVTDKVIGKGPRIKLKWKHGVISEMRRKRNKGSPERLTMMVRDVFYVLYVPCFVPFFAVKWCIYWNPVCSNRISKPFDWMIRNDYVIVCECLGNNNILISSNKKKRNLATMHTKSTISCIQSFVSIKLRQNKEEKK